jgi:hypothetical protein
MVLYPSHEQHFPTRLLPHRIEEYVRFDGQPPTTDRRFAMRLTGPQVHDAIVKAQERLNLKNIDPRYFVGTAFHEAGCSNEWDTEVATASCPPGFVSVGAYQISDEEARRYGYKLEDMLDLAKASDCMVRMAEDNRRTLRTAAGLVGDAPDPDYTDESGVVWKGGTLRAYLAIGHNHGMGYTKLTIQRYKMDWAAYKTRNPHDHIVDHAYGEDCVTGGPQWPGAASMPRLLYLANPRLTGPDVAEVQRHLTVHGIQTKPDGEYGPLTYNSVRLFQASKGMLVDGKVGKNTREALATPP